MARFQAAVSGAEKGGQAVDTRKTRAGETYQTKRSYTRLEDAWHAARGPLTEHGLSVTQWPTSPGLGRIEVITRVLHSSGQWMQSTLGMAIDESAKMNPTQKYGSAITYACRYAFLAALGLPPTDDDAEASGTRSSSAPRAPSTKKNKATSALEATLLKAVNLTQYRNVRSMLETLNPAQRALLKPIFVATHVKLSASKCPECNEVMDLDLELCPRCAPTHGAKEAAS